MKLIHLIPILVLLASCGISPEAQVPEEVENQPAQPYNLAMRNGLPKTLPPGVKVNYYSGSVLEKRIALTFDDGPHPVNTPRLLDILRAHSVPATFFVIGNRVDQYPNIARRIVREGHEIGNHTYTHANLSKLGDAGVRSELVRGRDAILRATGLYPTLFRPPYAALKTHQRYNIKAEFGYPIVFWNVDPLDWKRPGPSVVADRLVKGTRNGSILLVHDLHASSVDAIPETITRLKAQGYEFVTVSQLINRAAMLQKRAAVEPAL